MEKIVNPKIWLSSPHMGDKELELVRDAFSSNWIAPLGPHVDGFESDLGRYAGVKHVAALSSGTAAIHLALIILGVKAGDEVICSSFTFSASANPIVYQNAVPVFIDSERETWNMDPALLEEAIRDRLKKGKRPKAIIVVHLYGMPAHMAQIQQIAQNYDIPIIEDAAEAIGSTYQGKVMGSFGLLGVLSFNGNKIITTSGGGALLSDNADYIKQARFLATQARDNAPHYQHSTIGYNYRMSNICAAIGRGQMHVLAQRVQQRRHNYLFYKRVLGHLPGISFLDEPEGSYSNRWLTCITVEPSHTGGISRETIRLALAQDNIETRPLWKPLHLQPVFQVCPHYQTGVAEKLFDIGLCLPSGSNLSQQELERVRQGIVNLFNH